MCLLSKAMKLIIQEDKTLIFSDMNFSQWWLWNLYLLGHIAVWSDGSQLTFWRNMSLPSSGSNNKRRKKPTRRTQQAGQTSIDFHRTTRRYIPIFSIILSFVLYGCEMWSLVLSKESSPNVFKTEVLGKILSRVWVTIDGVWIGDLIYWPLIRTARNYCNSLTHLHTLKITVTAAHIKSCMSSLVVS
jgi:hypothetical protein